MTEEIMGVLQKMKGDKVACNDIIAVEMLKNGGISITGWLLRIFIRCTESGVYRRIRRQRV